MHRKPLFLVVAALGLSQAHDFGVGDGTNGDPTASPDANGSYWNNLLNRTGMADTFRLVGKQHQATGVKVKVSPNFLTNRILNRASSGDFSGAAKRCASA